MHKRFIITGGLFAAIGGALGAFGAHGLSKLTTDPKIISIFQTGVQYQMYHALAILLLGALGNKLEERWARLTGRLFIAGIILFSGSLYLLAALKIQESEATKFVGPITPIGGLLFISGWICMIMGASRPTARR